MILLLHGFVLMREYSTGALRRESYPSSLWIRRMDRMFCNIGR